MKRKIVLFAIVVAILISATACSSRTSSTFASATSQTDTVQQTENKESIEVINVVGKPADEAQDILEAAGFTNLTFEADKTGDSEYIIMKSNWTVTAQNPTESSSIAPDDEIILICKKTSEIEQENSTEKPTEKETEAPTEAPTETPNVYPESTYKVGQDMPAGEYVVFATSEYGGYYSVNRDSSGDLDSIISNNNFDYCDIVTVSNGQYFELSMAQAVPAADAQIDTSGDGTFRVGYEITAGEFKLQSTSEYGGYYAVYDSSYPDAEIVTNDNFEGTTYVTVSEGQYLKLSGCKIV